LDVISQALKNFRFGTNLSLIHSTVDIDSSHLAIIQEINPEAIATRPFSGQSPYIINANLTYQSDSAGLEVTVSYNHFGDRLSEISRTGTPDIYEKARGELNLLVTKSLGSHFSVKGSVKNILDSGFTLYNTFNSKEYIFQSYSFGRTFNLGVSYSL
jgi:hypothetical protein